MMKVEKYREANKINVLYDPHNPNESILKRGISYLSFFLMLVVGIGLFIFGLLLVQFGIYDLLL
ncbi:MAG: DUF3592 domain-containing protein [Candidatus Hermodarchaeota archaeon]